MMLTPRELDKLYIFLAAQLAQRRKARGLKLNHPESVAIITDHILEGARDGKSVSELMSSGKQVLSRSVATDFGVACHDCHPPYRGESGEKKQLLRTREATPPML